MADRRTDVEPRWRLPARLVASASAVLLAVGSAQGQAPPAKAPPKPPTPQTPYDAPPTEPATPYDGPPAPPSPAPTPTATPSPSPTPSPTPTATPDPTATPAAPPPVAPPPGPPAPAPAPPAWGTPWGGMPPTGAMPMPFPMPFPPPGYAPPLPPPPLEEDRSADPKLIFGIASLTVGAGMLVMLGVSQAVIGSIEEDEAFVNYRKGIQSNRNACNAAEAGEVVSLPGAGSPADIADQCSEAKTFEILSYVSIASGFGLLGLGGFLIVTSDTVSGPSSAVRIVPHIGHDRAGAALRYTF